MHQLPITESQYIFSSKQYLNSLIEQVMHIKEYLLNLECELTGLAWNAPLSAE